MESIGYNEGNEKCNEFDIFINERFYLIHLVILFIEAVKFTF